MNWEEGAIGTYRWVRPDGFILARVKHIPADYEYEAALAETGLGRFNSLEAAKKAVELAYENVGRTTIKRGALGIGKNWT